MSAAGFLQELQGFYAVSVPRGIFEVCRLIFFSFLIVPYSDTRRHLRESHCSQEGGSYVCKYGYNGVCSSLPVEGVNDEDYEQHVVKQHLGVFGLSGAFSGSE